MWIIPVNVGIDLGKVMSGVGVGAWEGGCKVVV